MKSFKEYAEESVVEKVEEIVFEEIADEEIVSSVEEDTIEEADAMSLAGMNAFIADLNLVSDMFKVKILRKLTDKSRVSIGLIWDFVPVNTGTLTSYEFAPGVKEKVFKLAKQHLGDLVKKPSDLKPRIKGKQFAVGAIKKELV